MAIPVSKPKIVKKHTKAFLRHDGDKYKRIGWAHKPTWRRPRGIDSRVRRRFKSNTRTVKIGFGTAKAHRHLLPNGLKAFNINNVSVRSASLPIPHLLYPLSFLMPHPHDARIAFEVCAPF